MLRAVRGRDVVRDEVVYVHVSAGNCSMRQTGKTQTGLLLFTLFIPAGGEITSEGGGKL